MLAMSHTSNFKSKHIQVAFPSLLNLVQPSCPLLHHRNSRHGRHHNRHTQPPIAIQHGPKVDARNANPVQGREQHGGERGQPRGQRRPRMGARQLQQVEADEPAQEDSGGDEGEEHEVRSRGARGRGVVQGRQGGQVCGGGGDGAGDGGADLGVDAGGGLFGT